jgi:hypothetical protein
MAAGTFHRRTIWATTRWLSLSLYFPCTFPVLSQVHHLGDHALVEPRCSLTLARFRSGQVRDRGLHEYTMSMSMSHVHVCVHVVSRRRLLVTGGALFRSAGEAKSPSSSLISPSATRTRPCSHSCRHGEIAVYTVSRRVLHTTAGALSAAVPLVHRALDRREFAPEGLRASRRARPPRAQPQLLQRAL